MALTALMEGGEEGGLPTVINGTNAINAVNAINDVHVIHGTI